MSQKLRENAIKTLAFFDLLNMPLTDEGVFSYLYWPERSTLPLSSVQQVLGSLRQDKVINKKGELYFLGDRDESIIDIRRSSMRRALHLLNKSMPWLSMMAGWPGVESISICNNLAFLNANEDSDIDLFIITKPNQVWQTRFALASFLQSFKKRPVPGNEFGKICISFFVVSDNLDLNSIAIENDIYLKYWLRSLMPIYDPNNFLEKVRQNNSQLYGDVARGPHSHKDHACPIQMNKNLYRISTLTTKPVSLFSDRLESSTKSWQMNRFPQTICDASDDQGTEVIISDQMLKFHTNDRRQYYRDEWVKRYELLI